MRNASVDLRKAALLALGCCALLALVLSVLGRATQTRASLLAQLQRPAEGLATVDRGYSATVSGLRLRMSLTLAVNRAGVPDPIRVTLSRSGGRPVGGARVSVSYSMPSMGMWGVYSSRLAPVAGRVGSYAATEGVLGMAGRWRIAVAVAASGSAVERFTLTDRMPT